MGTSERFCDEFRLIRELGRGATARVFEAKRERGRMEGVVAPDPGVSAPVYESVALKIFHPGLWDGEDLKKRALSEFKVLEKLDHPRIIRVIEPRWDHATPYVVMSYVEGGSLEELQPRLPYVLPELSVAAVMEVLEVLEYAHSQGVIHRDLKPANILVSSRGELFVSDFGLAKLKDRSWATLSGTVVGSPDFMSPEQARGDRVTEASDVFSMASILYFLVTGTRPFSRHSPLATLVAVCECKYEPVQRRNPKVSAELARLIHQGLEGTLDRRYPTAAAFRDALGGYLKRLGLTELTLAAWFARPGEAAIDSLRESSERLTIQCEEALKAREWDHFLEKLSHLSLVAPESAALVRLMKEYDRERARKRVVWVWASGGIAATAVAALLLGFMWSHRRAPQTVVSNLPPPPAAAVISVPSPATLALPVAAIAPAAGASSTSLKLSQAAPQPIARNSVKFRVPRDVLVYWDGVQVNSKAPLQGQAIGWHSLKLVKPGHPPINGRVAVKRGEPTLIQVD